MVLQFTSIFIRIAYDKSLFLFSPGPLSVYFKIGCLLISGSACILVFRIHSYQRQVFPVDSLESSLRAFFFSSLFLLALFFRRGIDLFRLA